jgi:hydrogenase expression/formation protein HypE
MMTDKKVITGKLSPEALKRDVLQYVGFPRPEMLIGPAVGEDAAVIKWPDGKYLIFSSDPIVGADKGSGRLLVRVNSNDIATKGGDPAFLAVTLILPPSYGEESAARIMHEIHEECLAEGIAVAGGHTEFNDRYDRPVIMGALIGMTDKVMNAKNIKTGDALLVTKHIGIEGMSILAADRPDLLKKFMSDDEISELLSWSDLTSVLAESRAVRSIAKFMHDPTDGGFLGGIAEISTLCGLKAEIDYEAVPVHPLTKRAAETLDFDPLHLIASGSLLIVVRAADVSAAQFALKNAGFESVVVGHMGEQLTAPIPDPVEELWRLLKLGA